MVDFQLPSSVPEPEIPAPLEEAAPPSVHKNASWSALLSIIVILAMIVIGAFYAWGKRVAEEQQIQQVPVTTSTTTSY